MSAALAIDPAQSEPIARQVTRALRNAIVTMALKPGEMLSEQEIATRLGVSRQPVREAFIKLGEAGLLQVLPQRGTRVVGISLAAVDDARFIREAVECAVVREAALRGSKAFHAALAENLSRQRRTVRGRDLAAFFALDEAFHRLLAAGAGRPRAWAIVEDVKPQMDRVRFLSMEDATPPRVLVDQHAAIVEAVKAGDPNAAETAMRVHLAEILSSLPKIAARHPDLFDGPR